MTAPITSTFATRRDAEMVVERLVQTHGVSRDAIRVAPDGQENTVGDRASGGDLEAADPSVEARSDAPVEGRIAVSVTPDSADDAEIFRAAFREFNGEAEPNASASV